MRPKAGSKGSGVMTVCFSRPAVAKASMVPNLDPSSESCLGLLAWRAAHTLGQHTLPQPSPFLACPHFNVPALCPVSLCPCVPVSGVPVPLWPSLSCVFCRAVVPLIWSSHSKGHFVDRHDKDGSLIINMLSGV